MKKLIVTLSVAAAAVAASLAVAGPGYGPGAGTGAGCAAADGTTACSGTPGTAMGMGMGPGAGMRGGRGHGMGYGLELMTPEERAAHRAQMRSLKTLVECNGYLSAHHAEMVARAAARGITLPEPRANACERMQAHGSFG
jgi:hypothetical protein